MTIQIPRRLLEEPLIEAIWQVQFEPEANNQVGEILPGILYGELSKRFSQVKLHRLPVADIPAQVAAVDPNLRYAAKYRIESPNTPFLFHVGDRVVALNCRRPYAGWKDFKNQLLALIDVLESSGLIPNPLRHSLRYIDLLSLESPPSLSPLKANIQIGDHAIVRQPLQMRVELPDRVCLHVLQVVSPAQAMLPEGKLEGTLIDLESIAEISETAWPSIRDGLEELHQASKNMFFMHVLTDEAIRAMKPEY